MAVNLRTVPCLWFDTQAEEAAKYYIEIFPNSRITLVTHYGEAGFEQHGKPAGSVLTVNFELDGQPFTALNGGPNFKFSEAISFQIFCDSQDEIDMYWEQLTEGGDVAAQQCGWLKDKYGLSWQVVPRELDDMVKDSTSEAGQRTFAAMMDMKKLDMATLKKAYEG